MNPEMKPLQPAPATAKTLLTLAVALGATALVVSTSAACSPEVSNQIALATPAAPGKCKEWIGQPVDRTCIPRIAMADRPLVLEIEERCGACGTTAEQCSVTLEGRTITLSLDGKACEPPAGMACRETCGRNRVQCKIPALPEGRYTVLYGDTSGRVDHFDATSGDGPTACRLGAESGS